MILLTEPGARLERALGNGENTQVLIALSCKLVPTTYCYNEILLNLCMLFIFHIFVVN